LKLFILHATMLFKVCCYSDEKVKHCF